MRWSVNIKSQVTFNFYHSNQKWNRRYQVHLQHKWKVMTAPGGMEHTCEASAYITSSRDLPPCTKLCLKWTDCWLQMWSSVRVPAYHVQYFEMFSSHYIEMKGRKGGMKMVMCSCWYLSCTLCVPHSMSRYFLIPVSY